jgi:hypothetical protein
MGATEKRGVRTAGAPATGIARSAGSGCAIVANTVSCFAMMASRTSASTRAGSAAPCASGKFSSTNPWSECASGAAGTICVALYAAFCTDG